MLSEAARRAKRSSPRSRSIPACSSAVHDNKIVMFSEAAHGRALRYSAAYLHYFVAHNEGNVAVPYVANSVSRIDRRRAPHAARLRKNAARD